jgi:hypothetical protein
MTTLLESFNTADSDTLGPTQTWVEDAGDFDVLSNKCRLVTNPAIARVSATLTTENQSVQVKVEVSAVGAGNASAEGLILRKAASATQTFYLYDAFFQVGTVRLFRCVATAFTSLASDIATTLNATTQYTLRGVVAGSSLATFVDGTAKHRVSDTNITGNLAVGIRGDYEAGHTNTADFDDFEAADFAAVTHRASTAGSGTTTTSVGIVIPASTAANDIVIAAFTNGGASADPSVADDEGAGTWAKILSGDDGNSNLSVWWKRASSSTASKTVTGSGFTNSCTGVVSVYSGALTSGNPYAGQTFQSNASGTESHAAITPTVNGSMVFLVVGQQPDIATSTQAATNPAVLTERAEHLSTGGLDCSVALASETQIIAGTTGALTWAQTNAATMSIAFYLTPQALGATTLTGVGAADGTGTATGVGRATIKAAGTNATGTGTATGVGRATIKAAGLAESTSTATATGKLILATVGNAAGTSTAAATGKSTNKAVGAADGTSTVTAVGNATAKAAGAADGTSTATAESKATKNAVGNAAGTSTAEAVGEDASGGTVTLEGDGLAAGTSTAAAVGLSTHKAAGLAEGTSTAAAIAQAFALAGGSAAGTSTAAAISQAIATAIGLAVATSTAAGISKATINAIGNAAGTSDATAVGEDAAAGAGLNDGDEVMVIQAGGIECCVRHDSGTLVSVAIASSIQISVVQAGGTDIRVQI